MKIHTNTLTAEQINDALNAEKGAGRIASHVSFKILSRNGSRSHARAFDIQLQADIRDNGRRAGNTGQYGDKSGADGYAATYDEWGWLLAALYRLDPAMIVGTVKSPVYENMADFHDKTGWTYHPELAGIIAIKGDPFPFTNGYTANWIGRRGYGRITADDAVAATVRGWDRHLKDAPRTAEWARAFFAGEVK